MEPLVGGSGPQQGEASQPAAVATAAQATLALERVHNRLLLLNKTSAATRSLLEKQAAALKG